MASILAKAITERPIVLEDDDGHLIRCWKPEELQRFTHAEIATALRFQHVVEAEDMLGTVPMTAVKYATSKGWLRASPAGWYRVTKKAANELDLPRMHRGQTIRFAP